MMTRFFRVAAAVGLVAAFAGAPAEAQRGRLSGSIVIDGSSTVYPITEAVAEEFASVQPRVRVQVGVSGTGGGFKKFAVGETDISDASRPIKASELDAARSNGINFVEIPVAYDGLSIIVSKTNTFVDHLTVEELQKIYLDGMGGKTWADIRAGWPNEPIALFSPGTDSGTFDYFKEVVAGKDGSIRSDMTVSEDDNVLVRGVIGNANAIGYFGAAYYFENMDKLRAIPIVNPDTGAKVLPTPETIEGGDYAPFSRPLFIYVSMESAKRPEVKAFVDFYLDNAAELAAEVGYVALPSSVYEAARRAFETGKTGTRYLDSNGEKVHKSVTELFR
ncbi:MAG: PstS family phosphate ABC transporter substrate-binding protein [Phycisphaerales bacterium]